MRGILQFLFKILVKIARTILRVFPVRSLKGGTRIYELAYRLSSPRSGSDVEVTPHGLRLVGPASDKFMMPGLYGGYYEEREVEVFKRLAAASRVIVDVGANIGLYACLGAAQLPEDGKLIAFEPVPDNLDYLRRNLVQNGMQDKVHVEAAAAGLEPGELSIHVIPENIGFASASTKRAADLGSTESVSVPVVTLDQYLEQRGGDAPDIIKTDTEGYDGFVLQGALATIKATQPTIFVEYLPRWLTECDFKPAELVDLIFDNYTNVFAIDEYCGRLSRITKDDLVGFGDAGNFHCANLIATSRPDHLGIIESLNPADRICSRVLTN
jgi:FkbM family methyltransferase